MAPYEKKPGLGAAKCIIFKAFFLWVWLRKVSQYASRDEINKGIKECSDYKCIFYCITNMLSNSKVKYVILRSTNYRKIITNKYHVTKLQTYCKGKTYYCHLYESVWNCNHICFATTKQTLLKVIWHLPGLLVRKST